MWLNEMFGDWLDKKRLRSDDTEVTTNQIATDYTDGALEIKDSVNSYILNFDWNTNNQSSMIDTYRDIAQFNDVSFAIEDIVNEMVSFAEDEDPVKLDLTDIEELGESTKNKIYERWDNLTRAMKLRDTIHNKVRNFYVDGRLAYQKVIDKNSPKKGIIGVVELDPRVVTKVRNVLYDPDSETINGIEEFFVYDETNLARDLKDNANSNKRPNNARYKEVLKLNKEALSYVTSGMTDSNSGWAIGWLHKAVKPANQLNMMENALVIYRIARAPERRVFYVDVGNLPKGKAEQYLQNLKNSYRNKMTYDPASGSFKDVRHLQTMQEDFWMPRNSAGKGTEVTTLSGGQNLGDIEDVKYFLNRLYKALNVPLSRLETDAISSLGGRATEINRDELKFSKFVSKIRKRFNIMFRDMLRTDLVLTNILTIEEFNAIEEKLRFIYAQDMYLEERKFFEMTRDRIELVGELKPYIGVYISNEYIRKEILKQTDEQIEEEDERIAEEAKNPQYQVDTEGNPILNQPVDMYDPNVIGNTAGVDSSDT